MKRHHDDEQERERKTRKAGRQGDVQITVVAVSREIGPEVGHFGREDVTCPPERHEPVTGEGRSMASSIANRHTSVRPVKDVSGRTAFKTSLVAAL